MLDGLAESPDLTVELNRAALEYISGASGVYEFISRARECIKGSREGCVFKYSVNAGTVTLLRNGYLNFARTFGLA